MINTLSLEDVMRYAPSAFTVQRNPNTTTERYTHVPTHNVIAGLMDAGWAPVQATESRCRLDANRGYQKHLIKFRRMEDINKAAELIPHIMLTNSHNGKSAYQLMAGIFRVICTNGLIVAKSMVGAYSFRHTGSQDDLISGSFSILKQMDKVFGRIDLWGGRGMDRHEQTSFAEQAAKLRWSDGAPIDPVQLLTPRRSEDRAADLWHVFNTVQENLMKGGLRYSKPGADDKVRRNSTRAIKAVDAELNINTRLWELAESYVMN